MATKRFIAVMLGGLLFAAIALLPTYAPVNASPNLAPTPVANLPGDSGASVVNFQPATALTSDTNTRSSLDLKDFEYVDLSYTIDHGTVNTTTLTVQYSNDGSNWVNGVALVSNSAADGSDITRIPMFGRYMRVNQDVTNSNAITITLIGVAK